MILRTLRVAMLGRACDLISSRDDSQRTVAVAHRQIALLGSHREQALPSHQDLDKSANLVEGFRKKQRSKIVIG